MRDIAAAAATLDPQAAAKPAHAKLVATAKPPGSWPNQARAARNSAVLMPELLVIEPISRNIGIAVRSQLAAKSNGVSRSTPTATLRSRSSQKPDERDNADRNADRQAQPDQDHDCDKRKRRDRKSAHASVARARPVAVVRA